MAIAEETPLLHGKSTKSDSLYPRNYIIPVVVVLFLFGDEIGNMTSSQYIVKYFKQHSDNSTGSDSVGNAENDTGNACNGNMSHSDENALQKKSANQMIYFQLIEYGVCLPTLMLFGIYTDKFGRKPFLLLPLLGSFCKYGVSALVVYFDLSINYICIGYGLSGLLGTKYGFYMVCSATIADVTSSGNSRTFMLAVLSYFEGIGLTLSQIATGYVIAFYGYAVPCIIACGTCILSIFLLMIIMKETLEDAIRQKCKSEGGRFLFSKALFFCCQKGESESTKPAQYLLVLMSLSVFHLPNKARAKIDILLLLGSPFCFSSEAIGWFEAARNFCFQNIGTVLIKIFLYCMNDESIGILGCLSCIAYFCGMGVATKEWILYADLILMIFNTVTLLIVFIPKAVGGGVLSTIPFPLLRAILSKMVAKTNQGNVFAHIYVMEAITNLSSQSLFLAVYAETRPIYRGMVYFLFCICCIGSIILIIPVIIHNKKLRKTTQEDLEINN